MTNNPGLRKRVRSGMMQRLLHPGIGCCERCRRPLWYSKAVAHCTMYTLSSGINVLCEDCWGELTPEDRWSWYRSFVMRHDGWQQEYEQVRTAVAEGR